MNYIVYIYCIEHHNTIIKKIGALARKDHAWVQYLILPAEASVGGSSMNITNKNEPLGERK